MGRGENPAEFRAPQPFGITREQVGTACPRCDGIPIAMFRVRPEGDMERPGRIAPPGTWRCAWLCGACGGNGRPMVWVTDSVVTRIHRLVPPVPLFAKARRRR